MKIHDGKQNIIKANMFVKNLNIAFERFAGEKKHVISF